MKEGESMEDKGITRRALRAMGKLPMEKEFAANDLPSTNYGMMARFIKYRLIQKQSYGRYLRISQEPVKDYYDRVRVRNWNATKLPAVPVSSRSPMGNTVREVAAMVRKIPPGNTFSIGDLGPAGKTRSARDSAFKRLVHHGIVKNVGYARYQRVSNGDPLAMYEAIPRRKPGRQAGQVSTNGTRPVHSRIGMVAGEGRAIQLPSGEWRIWIGKHEFTGVETVTVEKGDQHGRE